MGSIRKLEQTGALFFDFRVHGERCREYTALRGTPSNRKKLEKVMERIEADIVAGTFDYRRYFPTSKNAAKFDGRDSAGGSGIAAASCNAEVNSATPIPATPLFKDFAEIWFAEKQIEWRRSHRIGIRADLDRLLIPQFGEKEVGRIAKGDVLAYRAQLAKVPARGRTTQLSNNSSIAALMATPPRALG